MSFEVETTHINLQLSVAQARLVEAALRAYTDNPCVDPDVKAEGLDAPTNVEEAELLAIGLADAVEKTVAGDVDGYTIFNLFA